MLNKKAITLGFIVVFIFASLSESRRHTKNQENTCKNIQEGKSCGICRRLMTQLMSLYKTTGSASAVKNEATYLCVQFKLSTSRVCEGYINLNTDIVLFIIDRRPNLTPDTICGLFLQDQFCKYTKTKDLDWTIDIKGAIQDVPLKKCTGDKKRTCVHITDPHLDMNYRAGAESECNEPTCCRFDQESNPNKSESVPAGPWGNYNCDTPLMFLMWTLNNINDNIKNINCIYYTGDGIHHGSWATTFREVIDTFRTVNQAIRSVFPNVPVYPVFGNHDQQPMNMFAPPYLDIKNENISTSRQLYATAADEWRLFLGENTLDVYDTIKDEGYYTISMTENLRVIALNNNGAFTYNFWLLYDSTYLRKQLTWLHDTLLLAEKKSEFVHILVHMPSNDPNCFSTWAREYWRIIERFKNIIAAQFTGHSHRDQFNLFYSRRDAKVPISIAWNGGSITTYQKVNPNYKVYKFDECSGNVVSIDTYISDIATASLDTNTPPPYFLQYSLPNDYGMTNLGLQQLDELVTSRFVQDKKLLQNYCKFYIKSANTSLASDCKNTTTLEHLRKEIFATEPCYSSK